MKTQWNEVMNLFDSPSKPQMPLETAIPARIIDLTQNYNNKLSAETAFMLFLPDSPLYEVNQVFEIRLRGKKMLSVQCESKALYPFEKITSFISRLDRGMELETYKNSLKADFKKQGIVEELTFALLLMVILKDKKRTSDNP